MSDRWYIFKEGETLGPLTSAQIREGLRDGTFDPFDLVARDGSSVRRELVEVDEIFANSKVVYGEALGVNEAYGRQAAANAVGEENSMAFVPQVLVKNAADVVGGVADASATQVSNRPGEYANIGRGHLALADQAAQEREAHGAQATPKVRKRRDAKRYSLVDGKGRMLGPMSAAEIQSLYYKGVLDKRVVVVRQGSQARVAVAKFVAVYSEAKQAKGPQQAAHPAVGAIARRRVRQSLLQRLAKVQQASNATARKQFLVKVAIGLAVVLVLAAIWIVWVHLERSPDDHTAAVMQVEQMPQARPSKASAKLRDQKVATGKETPQDAPRSTGDKRPSNSEILREKSQADLGAKSLKGQTGAISQSKLNEALRRERDRRARQQAQNVRQRQAVRPLPDFKKRQARSSPAYRPAVATRSQPPAQKLPSQRSSASLRPPGSQASRVSRPQIPPLQVRAYQPVARASAAQPARISVADLRDGQSVARLGPMSFERAAIQRCQVMCTVIFRGPPGALQVNFVKSAWGAALLSKRGRVYIGGLVRKSGGQTKLILQGVIGQ